MELILQKTAFESRRENEEGGQLSFPSSLSSSSLPSAFSLPQPIEVRIHSLGQFNPVSAIVSSNTIALGLELLSRPQRGRSRRTRSVPPFPKARKRSGKSTRKAMNPSLSVEREERESRRAILKWMYLRKKMEVGGGDALAAAERKGRDGEGTGAGKVGVAFDSTC